MLTRWIHPSTGCSTLLEVYSLLFLYLSHVNTTAAPVPTIIIVPKCFNTSLSYSDAATAALYTQLPRA